MKFDGKWLLEIDLQRIDRLRDFDCKITTLRLEKLCLANNLTPGLAIESQVAANSLEILLVI